MNEWNIQSRAHACQSCGKAFYSKQTYHTLLFDEKSEFTRLDVCSPCWEQQYSEGARDRKGFVSHWQGIYEPPLAAPDPIQKATAESLLRQLTELNDPKFIPASYILAVMLERKRLLKIKEQLKRDDHRVFVYEQPKTGDLFTIIDPDLQLNQLEQVQRDVATLLEQGLPAPAPPEAASTAEGAGIPSSASQAPDSNAAELPHIDTPVGNETSAAPLDEPGVPVR